MNTARVLRHRDAAAQRQGADRRRPRRHGQSPYLQLAARSSTIRLPTPSRHRLDAGDEHGRYRHGDAVAQRQGADRRRHEQRATISAAPSCTTRLATPSRLSSTPVMNTRVRATATLLPNGKVLIAGGSLNMGRGTFRQHRAVRSGYQHLRGLDADDEHRASERHGDAAAQRQGADRRRRWLLCVRNQQHGAVHSVREHRRARAESIS